MKLIVLLAILGVVSPTCGYHILCIFPVPSRSHNRLGHGIVDALLKAGHEVTWATPYSVKNPQKGLNIIDLSSTVKIIEAIDMTDQSRTKSISFVKEFSSNISTTAINTPALRDVLVKKKFDAVVTEWFFSDIEAGYAAIQEAPWILLSGVVMHPHMELLVDDVRSVSTIPLMFNDYSIPMTFLQRLHNTFVFCMMTFGNWIDFSSTSSLFASRYGPLAAARGVSLPTFEEAFNNVSILFVNSHPSFAYAQPLPPNVVEIGGYHIDENIPPLPKDLQDVLDSSPQGVIYFSMGSVLKSAHFPEKTKKELLKVFSELPYTVLWKFETEITGLPKNVHVRKWMPQPSILAHPNIKLFITHGGLLSGLEAIHSGVPLLAIPMFGDQPANAARAQRNGYARTVSFSEDMASELNELLKEMMTNDSYYKRAKYLSKLFRNRPVSPSKLIAHYTEVAIETKGAFHLRSKARLYPWYERWMLDQAALVLALLYLIYKILKALFAYCCKSKNVKDKKQKKS